MTRIALISAILFIAPLAVADEAPAAGTEAVPAAATDAAPADETPSPSPTLVASAADVLPAPPVVTGGTVPLSEPIAPVPPGLAKWAFGATIATGLADPFYDKLALQLSARRGFGRLALELSGGRAISWASPALALCQRSGTCGTPGSAKLGATPGNLGWLASAGVVYRVAEGKVSLAGLQALPFSFEAGAGAAAVSYRVIENTADARFAPGGKLSLGLATDLSPTFSARVELQGLGYLARIRDSNVFERQLIAGFTVGWRPQVSQ